jgi:hypothetical protein
MKALLNHFFKSILNMDVAIQEATPQLFICSGAELRRLEYQNDMVSNLLEMYGLSQVITSDFTGKIPTLTVDFGAKWHRDLEEASYKFLPSNTTHWDSGQLNAYASVIEDLGLSHKHRKLASHALLFYNFRVKPPKRLECFAEKGSNGNFLTFPENGISTVLYCPDAGSSELVHMGPSSYSANALKYEILEQFKWANLKEAHYIIQKGYIEVNDQSFTDSQLDKVCKASSMVASSNNVFAKLSSLRRILKGFEALA